MACTGPLSDDVLLAWWAGDLAAPEQEGVETHLFACEDCARRGQQLAAVGQGFQDLVRKGELPTALPSTVIDRLQREGRRIREYRLAPGETVQCTVGPDDDMVLARLGADLHGVSRLDLSIRVGDAPEQRLTEMPFDPTASELIFAPSADWLRGLPAHVQRLRLLAVESEGERVLGEYVFDHTPWPGA